MAEATATPSTFETPEQYLAAMQSIGMRPVAGFRCGSDEIPHYMGVYEYAPREWHRNGPDDPRWDLFHAIQMRCPVEPALDRPCTASAYWWREVWDFLYERGLREDVTKPKAKN